MPFPMSKRSHYCTFFQGLTYKMGMWIFNNLYFAKRFLILGKKIRMKVTRKTKFHYFFNWLFVHKGMVLNLVSKVWFFFEKMWFFEKKKHLKYWETNFHVLNSDSKSNLKSKMTLHTGEERRSRRFFNFYLFWNFIRKMFSF